MSKKKKNIKWLNVRVEKSIPEIDRASLFENKKKLNSGYLNSLQQENKYLNIDNFDVNSQNLSTPDLSKKVYSNDSKNLPKFLSNSTIDLNEDGLTKSKITSNFGEDCDIVKTDEIAVSERLRPQKPNSLVLHNHGIPNYTGRFQELHEQLNSGKNIKHSRFSLLSVILCFGLFMASLTFWFFIVQPTILDKITDVYAGNRGYTEVNRLEAIKEMEKMDKALEAAETDIQNIRNLACSNNNAELNIKKFEDSKYIIAPKDEVVISGFWDEYLDKKYLNYVIALNTEIEQRLLNKDLGTLAFKIQSLNNLSVNCARSVERHSNEDSYFIQNVCSDIKNSIARFGVADTFELNKVCQNTDKAKFLESLDNFIINTADNIAINKDDDWEVKIDELKQTADSQIISYYNQKINFPENIYLLKVKN